jgi:hypothetical protein
MRLSSLYFFIRSNACYFVSPGRLLTLGPEPSSLELIEETESSTLFSFKLAFYISFASMTDLLIAELAT